MTDTSRTEKARQRAKDEVARLADDRDTAESRAFGILVDKKCDRVKLVEKLLRIRKAAQYYAHSAEGRARRDEFQRATQAARKSLDKAFAALRKVSVEGRDGASLTAVATLLPFELDTLVRALGDATRITGHLRELAAGRNLLDYFRASLVRYVRRIAEDDYDEEVGILTDFAIGPPQTGARSVDPDNVADRQRLWRTDRSKFLTWAAGVEQDLERARALHDLTRAVRDSIVATDLPPTK